jgi:GT2 family glycosyltransferase
MGNSEGGITAQSAARLDIEFSIVSGSNESLLFSCLESLYSTMEDSRWSWTITVTSNAHPGLPERLVARFPSVTIIENETSRGFAANHNTVVSRSAARYVWLLNDDLVILPGAVATVTDYLENPANSRVAVVSPKLLNPDGTLQPSTYGFPSMPQILLAHSGMRDSRITNALLRTVAPVMRSRKGSSRFWAHDAIVEVDTFRGACVAMRMEAIREVGLMVEVAVVGAEETEWHRRFHDHGWKVVYHPGAQVIHYGSQTVGGESSSLLPEYLKGALYFFRTGRSASTYRLFRSALIAMFNARLAVQRMKGDAEGVAITQRYLQAAKEGAP